MINGIPGPASLPDLRPLTREPGAPSDGASRSGTTPATVPQPEQARGASVEAAAGSSAPQGVDPALWSVLTTEERDFFVRNRARGPLTYGPGATPSDSAAPPAGGRLDIRV